MTTDVFVPPPPDTVLEGLWPAPVRVVRAVLTGNSVRVQAVSVTDGQFWDRMIPLDQYRSQVRELQSGIHSFDASPKLFRLATEALRTQLAHSFDPQFAVSVSQVDPLPHQIEAVYKHILPLPRIRFLLADDPGAGKTIMAGLLMRELMQRHDVKRVLVLCPKGVTDQWRREMWDRFKERFTLLTGETVRSAFGQNVWVEHDLVVASIDLATEEHIQPGLEQAEWDLVIFDEAHKLSAYRYGRKIEKTRRYQLAEKLGPKTRHLLLMTATPHKGDPENFRLLLSLLDEQVFASQEGAQRAIEGDDSPYFLRRMKETMRDWDGKPLFLDRRVSTPRYQLAPHELALYEDVTSYVQREWGKAERAEARVQRNVGLALTILQRRLTSSLYAVTRSLERRRDRLTEALKEIGKGSRTSGLPGQDPADYDEDYDDSEQAEEMVAGASAARTPEELRAEIGELERLIAHARSAMSGGPERKVEELQRLIGEETVAKSDEKILIFTEHKDTLDYLARKLREWGLSSTQIHGGMSLQDRVAAEKEFRGSKQFLVATDAAGEGINLQFCRVMVNWDLPWNPNRLEQRMGRIHRYGQQYDVQIVNLVAENTREGSVLARLMEKLDRMRRALGHDQVFDVIQDVLEIGSIRLDVLMKEAILGRRSMDDVLATFDALETETAVAKAREALGEALATRYIDMAFLQGEERESRERRLTPEFVEDFFARAFEYLRGRLSRGRDRDWRLEHVPVSLRKAARAANTGEQGEENRLITFHKERLNAAVPAEFVAPDHPLFDAVAEAIMAEGKTALAKGTVFVDREATSPYLVWLLEAAVVNGADDTVHVRLLALKQEGESFEAVSPGLVLDLPPDETAPAIPQSLVAVADGDRAAAVAASLYADEYLAEVTARQERECDIVWSALDRSTADSLELLRTELERQQADRESGRGRDMDLAIRTTNQKIDAILAERSHRQADLERRRVTSLVAPRVAGVAAVITGPVPAVGVAGGNKQEIELAGMRVAMEYERARGRVPEDVSRQHAGYDIRSTGGDGEARYIEAKAHQGDHGDVTLYYTEWQMAHRLGEEFFIYEVADALGAPRLRIVQDPVGKGIEPEVKVVEYRIGAAALAAHAAPPGLVSERGETSPPGPSPRRVAGGDLSAPGEGGVEEGGDG
ncbi:MAG: DUF3883 domain-containing protein [Dehalococcoidia bacterium]|nr:DUF3883 domain-containing protein [Dehalococcoidia bacterium]